MSVMLERWNDDKMDALVIRIDERFDQVDKRFEQVDERFEQVDKRFEQVDRRFERIEVELRELRKEMKAGFDRLQRLMLQFCGGLIVALFVALATRV